MRNRKGCNNFWLKANYSGVEQAKDASVDAFKIIHYGTDSVMAKAHAIVGINMDFCVNRKMTLALTIKP